MYQIRCAGFVHSFKLIIKRVFAFGMGSLAGKLYSARTFDITIKTMGANTDPSEFLILNTNMFSSADPLVRSTVYSSIIFASSFLMVELFPHVNESAALISFQLNLIKKNDEIYLCKFKFKFACR